MIIGTLRIPLPTDRRAEVIQILQSIRGPVSALPGCAGCHIYEEEDPERAVVLVERWESESALEEHVRSEAYRRILGAIELSGSPPEVCFDFVSHSKGMGLIERLRNVEGTARNEPGDAMEGATGGDRAARADRGGLKE